MNKSWTSEVAKCLDCRLTPTLEVQQCRSTDCPLWPHRMEKGHSGGADQADQDPVKDKCN